MSDLAIAGREVGVERHLRLVRLPVGAIRKRSLGLGLCLGVVWPCFGHDGMDRWWSNTVRRLIWGNK